MSHHIIPPQTDLIMVSDVHLKSAEDDRGRMLLEIISAATLHPPKYFVLLGDIFDFCLGSTDYFKKKFHPIGIALTQLSSLGTRVIFFEGNHEFDLPRVGWAGVEFVGEGTLDFTLPSGVTVRAAHGDLVHATRAYKLFRRFLKSALVRFICTHIVPSRLLDAYALSHAHVSRASDHYRRLNHDALLQDVSEWLGKADIGMIGHFHTPYFESLNNNQTLLSVRDWSSPNFLLMREDKIWRGTYADLHWSLQLAEKTQYAAT